MRITPIATTNYMSSPQNSGDKAQSMMSFSGAPKLPTERHNSLAKKTIQFFKSIWQKGEKKLESVSQPSPQEEVKVAKLEQVEPLGIPDKVFYGEDGTTIERVIKYNSDKKPIKETLYKKDGQSVSSAFEKEYSPETGRLIKEVKYDGTGLVQITEMDANSALITKKLHYAKDGKTLDRVEEYNKDGMSKRIQYRSDGKTISSMIEYQGDIMNIIGYRSDWKAPNMKESYKDGCLTHRVYYNSDGSIDQIIKFNTRTGEEKLKITNIGNGEFETERFM